AARLAAMLQRSAGGPATFAAYQRRQVMGFDVTAPAGPLILRLDAAYSPEQTVYVTDGTTVAPVRRPAVTYTAAVEYRYEERFFALVQWLHLVTVTRPDD